MKILDPQVSWKGTSLEEVWGGDPVHPTAEGYAKLAAGVEAICLSIESGAKKRAIPTALRLGTGLAACTTDREPTGRQAAGNREELVTPEGCPPATGAAAPAEAETEAGVRPKRKPDQCTRDNWLEIFPIFIII
jgi:hypothetical protein